MPDYSCAMPDPRLTWAVIAFAVLSGGFFVLELWDRWFEWREERRLRALDRSPIVG